MSVTRKQVTVEKDVLACDRCGREAPEAGDLRTVGYFREGLETVAHYCDVCLSFFADAARDTLDASKTSGVPVVPVGEARP